MEIVPDRFKFIFGTKLEHNDFTGFEVEPTIRGVWTPSRSQTIWGAVSRATRTPSRADNDVFLMSNIRQDPTTGLPLEADVIGNRDLQSEDLLAVEIGYRHQSSKRFSLDLALFFNHYQDLRSYEARSPQLVPFPSPVIHVPLVASDSLRADTFGGEIVSDILVLPELHVQLGYSYVDINLSNEDGVNLAPVTEPDRETPQSQFFFRSMLDLPQGWELDSTLRWVDNIPQFGIDAYTEMSVRLGWKASKNLELSLLVANFFHDDHREYDINVFGGQAAEVERSILGRVVWKF
jgi:iron complex outermembrane receptor protein